MHLLSVLRTVLLVYLCLHRNEIHKINIHYFMLHQPNAAHSYILLTNSVALAMSARVALGN